MFKFSLKNVTRLCLKGDCFVLRLSTLVFVMRTGRMSTVALLGEDEQIEL